MGSGDLRSRLEEPPVGREGETALEPSGRWERDPMLYLPMCIVVDAKVLSANVAMLPTKVPSSQCANLPFYFY